MTLCGKERINAGDYVSTFGNTERTELTRSTSRIRSGVRKRESDESLIEGVAMKSVIVRFVREDAGQDLIEYAMLATLIALVAGVAATALGTNLSQWYTNMSTKVSGWATSAS